MKKLLLIFVLSVSIFAIQIELKTDKSHSASVSNIDKDALKEFLQTNFHFHVSDEGAFNIVKENRVLANIYLKKFGLNKYDRARIRIETEMYLSNQYVKTIQQKIRIPDKVTYSYYLDHRDQFKKSDKLDAVIFIFKDPDQAIDFYKRAKNKSLQEMKRIAQELNATIKKHTNIIVNELKNPIKAIVLEKKRSQLLIPPVFDVKYASVFYIKNYMKEDGYKPFEQVKGKIEEILYSKTFSKIRDKVLKQYNMKE